MYRVAIVKNQTVDNVVIADSLDAVQALPIFLENELNDSEDVQFILETDETGRSFIGGKYVNNKFSLPSPYPSWVFDNQEFKWNAPVAVPEYSDNQYPQWNEDSQKWDILDIPISIPDPEE